MKISVFGLGYVGTVTAACFAEIGHKVIGVDVVGYKVDSINNKSSPIEEKGINELIEKHVILGSLRATKNTDEAVKNTEASFICVGTPPTKTGDLDLAALKKVCEEIGKSLKNKESHLIVIRSTMFPGSLNILKEILEKSSGKKEGRDFELAVNPEFLREGSALKDFFNPPMIVIGTGNKKTGEKILNIYNNPKQKKFIVSPELAQMIKYASNSFHALKVTYANEIGAICSKLKINSQELMGLFCQDTQLNISPYYFKPGFAYGGSCLPKDLAALKNNAVKLGVECPVLESISKSNMSHMERAVELIKSAGRRKIGILGLAFKPDTDDIRGNPILFVINRLLGSGYEIKIFDKIINESDLEIINQSYRKEIFDLVNMGDLKESVNNISNLFADLNSVLNQEVIVVSNRDASLKDYLKNLSKSRIIVDLQNIFKDEKFQAEYLALA